MNFYEGLIKSLKENEIFVFGSNPEGKHGAGTAKIAKERYGAVYGKGRGLQGNSYALITKNLTPGYTEQISPRKKIIYETSGNKSVSKEQIKDNIKEFYKLARKEKEKFFYVAYQNDGKNLNGYTSEEMFDLFTQGFNIPKNVYFSKTFEDMAYEKGILFINEFDISKDGVNHINTYSKGKTKLGRMLSNMSNVSATIDIEGKKYKFKSLEGYWYYLKLWYLFRKQYLEFKDYDCFKAKEKAREIMGNKKEIALTKIEREEFNEKMSEAFRLKIFQNKQLYNLLKNSTLPFEHYYYYGNEDNYKVINVPEARPMLDYMEAIRKEIQQNTILPNKITIINKHKTNEPHIYCGRGSVLGNPYVIKDKNKNHKGKFEVSTRDEACDKYKEYFDLQIKNKNEAFLQELRNIYSKLLTQDVNLGCFCAPQRCHCETIKDFIEEKMEEQLKK